MPAKRNGRDGSLPPSASEEVPAEVPVEAAQKSATSPPQEEFPDLPTTKRAIMPRTTTSYSDVEKEEILEFLKSNPSLYEKRTAGFKNQQLKACLWQQQAEKMGTTVHELKTWYSSQRTKLGRLKQAVKKSGQGYRFTATDQWVWDNFQFLVAHIIDTDHRNVFSLKSELNSATAPSTSGAAPVLRQSSSETKDTTPAPTLPLPALTILPYDDTDTIGPMLKEFLAKESTVHQSPGGASYFALYVDTNLKQLPGSLRREAELRIQQVLHDVEYKAEQQRSQQGVTQQQCQQQSQGYQNWQPHPSQWPTQLQEHSPSVWQSQDRHNQFHQQMNTSPPPMASSSGTQAEPQSCPSDILGKTYIPVDVEPVGEDVVNQSFLDLLAVAQDVGIPVDMEDDS